MIPLRFLAILAIPDDATVTQKQKNLLSIMAFQVSREKDDVFKKMKEKKSELNMLIEEYSDIINPDVKYDVEKIIELKDIYKDIFETMDDYDAEHSITSPNQIYLDYIFNNATDSFVDSQGVKRLKHLLTGVDTSRKEIADPLLATMVPMNDYETVVISLLRIYFEKCSKFLKEINQNYFSWKPCDILEISRKSIKCDHEYSDLKKTFSKLKEIRNKIDKLRHKYIPDVCKPRDDVEYTLDLDSMTVS